MTEYDDAMTQAMARAAERMPHAVAAAASGMVLLFDEAGSTNTVMREALADGRLTVGSDAAVSGTAADVAIVAADTQTAGRGRLDHVWVSRAGESFTVSFAIAVPRSVATNANVNGWLQMIAGLSARDALLDVTRGLMPLDDPPAGILLKWPNDIFCGGRKLGGVLAEMVFLPDDPRSVALVFGIGLNLAVPADRLPTGQSTSLQLHYQVGDAAGAHYGIGDAGAAIAGDAFSGTVGLPAVVTDAVRDRIAARVVASLRSRIASFVARPHDEAGRLLAETKACCWTLGKQVEAHFTDGSTLRGTALALNPDASLTIRDDNGETRIVRTADVGVLA
nr:biotin--acetyl-CoA-carboxylase ligase [Bifidobacterium aerophilum]